MAGHAGLLRQGVREIEPPDFPRSCQNQRGLRQNELAQTEDDAYSLITKIPPSLPAIDRGIRSFFLPIASRYLEATPLTKSSPPIATPIVNEATRFCSICLGLIPPFSSTTFARATILIPRRFILPFPSKDDSGSTASPSSNKYRQYRAIPLPYQLSWGRFRALQSPRRARLLPPTASPYPLHS